MGPTRTPRARRGRPRPSRRLALRGVLVSLALAALAGCSSLDVEGSAEEGTAGEWSNLGLPEGITDQSDRITTLWVGAWITALLVGAVVWGLILFAAYAYRRRRGDTGLPPQVRYNMPIEVLYTTVPIVIVAVYFFFTARDQQAIAEVTGDAEHVVEVVGKRWSWDFNYLSEEGEADVYETGTPGIPPTLVLPRGETVEFWLVSRDVIHSFWVVPFLYKQDVFPGRVNTFEVTALRNGTYAGKCAELCGQDHARMLFGVRVVDPDEYDDYIESLRERGQVGRLPAGNGPTNVPPTSADDPPQEGSTEIDTRFMGPAATRSAS